MALPKLAINEITDDVVKKNFEKLRDFFQVQIAALTNPKAPTLQKFVLGTSVYVLPTTTKPLYLKVKMVGGGGGGAGSSDTASPDGGAGGTGTATTFGTSLLTANGGVGAAGGNTATLPLA